MSDCAARHPQHRPEPLLHRSAIAGRPLEELTDDQTAEGAQGVRGRELLEGSPTILGFSSLDFVMVAGVFLSLALVLAARTWVKLNEPRLLGVRSQTGLMRRPGPAGVDEPLEEPTEPSVPPEAARADRR